MNIELEIERTKLQIELIKLDIQITREAYIEDICKLASEVAQLVDTTSQGSDTLEEISYYAHINSNAEKHRELQLDLRFQEYRLETMTRNAT